MRLSWGDVTEVVADITPAVHDVSTIGPFFAICTDAGERADRTWRPLVDFHADHDLLCDRLNRVGAQLGTDEERVAASLGFQALAARLVAPPLALAASHRVLPALAAAELFLQPTASAPWPLRAASPVRGRRADSPAQAAAMFAELVVEPLLTPLVVAFRRVSRVAEPLLWGNAASSLAGAVTVLAAARPGAAPRARSIVGALLDLEPMAGSGRYQPDGGFRRRSCCLYYRTPDGGLCGDCPFDAPPGR
jgi:ferric iron reductase protein FhuF